MTDALAVRDVPGAATAAPAAAAVMTKVVGWIDATLHLYCREHPPGDRDVPGLARSHASILKALAPRSGAAVESRDARAQRDGAWRELCSLLETAGAGEPLGVLRRELGLSDLELAALLLGLAPELDVRYHGVLGVLNDDLGRRSVTLGLLCSLLGDPPAVRGALEVSGGLARWRLLERGATPPYADEPLRIDPVIVTWLLGRERAVLDDPRLAPVLRSGGWDDVTGAAPANEGPLVERLAGLLSTSDLEGGWVVLAGPDPGRWRAIAAAAVRRANVPLLRASWPPPGGGDSVEAEDLAARLGRAVRLEGAVSALDLAGGPVQAVDRRLLTHVIETLTVDDRPGLVVATDAARVVGALPRDRVLVLQGAPPDPAALTGMFAAAAAEAGLCVSPAEAGRLALSFPFPSARIGEAVRLAALERPARGERPRPFTLVAAACRRLACPELSRFARRVEPAFELADVVLPADRHEQLKEIIAHVRHASRVLHAWGFGGQLPYGRGVAALFSGPSGTGKTMAAQAIARALETESYVVDLSRVVSKYIGESEKNLDAVFSDAERAGAVLVFDEADALFGKRSEIKDAHDRYANIEVAYLLQRMEEFSGLAILTTNLRRNLDEAFLRRLRFVVEFPKPGPEAREAIWRQCLPDTAPRGHDVGDGIAFLARRLEITGGTIRQVTLRAAFAAADEGGEAITTRHVLAATRAELLKLGLASAERDLAEYDAIRRAAESRVA